MASADKNPAVAKSLADLGKLTQVGVTEVQQPEDVVEERNDDDEVIESTKSSVSTGKKNKHKVKQDVGNELVTEDNSEVEAAVEGATVASNIPEGFAEVTDSTVIRETIIRLPKKKCHMCRHLMPTMPDTLPKEFGGNGKPGYGGDFDCYTDEMCPARYIQLEYNPFTDAVVKEAVDAFKESGDMDELLSLYTKAQNASKATWQDVHQRVCEMLKD
jgi:hypothetical protein